MKTRFLIPAQRELHDAVLYYNAQRPHLGDKYRDEVWETLRWIVQFPYGVIYEASDQELIIIALAHMHREPAYWRARR